MSICWKFEGLFNKNKYFYYYLDNSEPNEENINNIFLLIYKLSEQIQRPIKILIFSLDLPVYLSDSHSGGKYRCSIAVSNLCIVYISGQTEKCKEIMGFIEEVISSVLVWAMYQYPKNLTNLRIKCFSLAR